MCSSPASELIQVKCRWCKGTGVAEESDWLIGRFWCGPCGGHGSYWMLPRRPGLPPDPPIRTPMFHVEHLRQLWQRFTNYLAKPCAWAN